MFDADDGGGYILRHPDIASDIASPPRTYPPVPSNSPINLAFNFNVAMGLGLGY